MSEEKEVERSVEGPREKPNDVINPMKVRKKTVVDVLIDRASTTTVDVIKNRIGPGIVDLLHDASIGILDGLFDRGRSSRSIRNSTDISRRGVKTTSRSNNSSFSYNEVSSRPSRSISDAGRRNHNFDELVFESRVEAQEALDKMRDRLELYDVVSVADLYSIAGVDDTIQDNKWGWTNLDGAYVRKYRQGFILALPETKPLG